MYSPTWVFFRVGFRSGDHLLPELDKLGILFVIAAFLFQIVLIIHFSLRKWRNPLRWSIGGPYLLIYLATVMFYWWPLALINKPLCYVYAGLFVISTVLNVTSHK